MLGTASCGHNMPFVHKISCFSESSWPSGSPELPFFLRLYSKFQLFMSKIIYKLASWKQKMTRMVILYLYKKVQYRWNSAGQATEPAVDEGPRWTGELIDNVCQKLFPGAFTLFNIVYWYYYTTQNIDAKARATATVSLNSAWPLFLHLLQWQINFKKVCGLTTSKVCRAFGAHNYDIVGKNMLRNQWFLVTDFNLMSRVNVFTRKKLGTLNVISAKLTFTPIGF